MNGKRANSLGRLAFKGTRCESSGKIQHRTRRKALRGSGNRTHNLVLRAYVCPDCGFWHASTKHKKEAVPWT